MEEISLRVYHPHPFLRPYISKLWALESKYGIPQQDLKLIAPNGEMKLVIPYQNNMRSTIDNNISEHRESSIIVIGQMTTAAIIESEMDFGSIGVDFKPRGAYRFFAFPLNEIQNHVYHAPDIFGSLGNELQAKISDAQDVREKIRLVEKFLYQQFISLGRFDPVLEYAIAKIETQSGLLSIEDLSKDVGYSRRQLTRKFTEQVGLSPKEFACIVRFHTAYRQLMQNTFTGKSLYNLYYDQAHYIKEFKRYTGLAPGDFISQSNQFGSIFYNV